MATGPRLDFEQRQEASRLEERCADSDEISAVLYELIDARDANARELAALRETLTGLVICAGGAVRMRTLAEAEGYLGDALAALDAVRKAGW